MGLRRKSTGNAKEIAKKKLKGGSTEKRKGMGRYDSVAGGMMEKLFQQVEDKMKELVAWISLWYHRQDRPGGLVDPGGSVIGAPSEAVPGRLPVAAV